MLILIAVESDRVDSERQTNDEFIAHDVFEFIEMKAFLHQHHSDRFIIDIVFSDV